MPVLLGGVLALGGLPGQGRADPAPLGSQIAGKQQQVRQLTLEKEQIQEKLAYFQQSEKELRLETRRLSQFVATSRKRKQELAAEIQARTEQQARQERELTAQQASIQQSRERIGQRLRRLYRLSKLSSDAYFFQTARFQTIARDSHLLALLQDTDRQAIQRYEALVLDTRKKQEAVEKALKRLAALREELSSETQQLGEREAFLKTSLETLEKNRKLYRKYLNDLQKMMEGMEAAVKKLETRAAAKTPEARARRPEELRGQLPAPVRGRIIAGFGEQDPRYDLKKFQRGIVIRVGPNAEVRAVAPGSVVHAGPFRGYQSLVVLNHGRGLFTVYGHLQDLRIQKGQWVAAGAPLGRATYQAVDQAYDLYFEVRYKGSPEDPLHWLKPGALTADPKPSG